MYLGKIQNQQNVLDGPRRPCRNAIKIVDGMLPKNAKSIQLYADYHKLKALLIRHLYNFQWMTVYVVAQQCSSLLNDGRKSRIPAAAGYRGDRHKFSFTSHQGLHCIFFMWLKFQCPYRFPSPIEAVLRIVKCQLCCVYLYNSTIFSR